MTFTAGELFASAVPFYARYRPGYPTELVDSLAERLGLDGSQRVLDIGCGPGLISIPLARHAREVIAVDPVADMLADGRAAAERAGIGNIRWLRGDSTQLIQLAVPTARLAVFAASFHWTDRAAVVRTLDRLLEPDGAIVVVKDALTDVDQPDWVRAIDAIRTRYVGPHLPALPPHFGRSHHDVLAGSPFSVVETLHWSWRRELTVEQIVGLQFSYSFSSPVRFGDRAAAFADDVRAAVLARHPSGTVVEPVRLDVLIARRP